MDAAYLPGSNAKIRVEAEINGVTHVLEGTARDVELDVKTDYTDVHSWDFNATYQDLQKTVLTAVFKDGYTWTKKEKKTPQPKVRVYFTNDSVLESIDYPAERYLIDNDGRLHVYKNDSRIASYNYGSWESAEKTEDIVP